MLNSRITRDLYLHIARDMEGSGHYVIGAIAHILKWKKRVSRFEVLPEVAEDLALWTRMCGS